MALLNRRLKDKNPESFPLVDDEDEILAEFDEQDASDEDESIFQHHGITLWVSDSLLMLIEHIQIFAVFLVLSERWSWPLDWIKETSFLLLFNLDIWEFRKINDGYYEGASNTYVPSENMFSYKTYLISWTAVAFSLLLGYFVLYRFLIYKRPLYLLLYLTRMKRVFSIVAQLLCIPIGLVVARLFQCRSKIPTTLHSTKIVLNVANKVECWSGSHAVYGLEALAWFLCLLSIFFFIVYPVYLCKITRRGVFTHSSKQHEGYLQLKEAEYLKGLDIVWAVEQFFLFSSYCRPWVYYRSIMYFLRFLLVVVYAMSLQYQVYPIAVVTATLFILALVMMVLKPFRVNVFNVMKIISLLCNSLNALVGVLLELKVESAILIYPYIKYVLIGINSFVLLAFVIFFSYLVLHHYGVIRKRHPLWPALSQNTTSKELDPNTRHYLRAVLKGRQVLERALSTPPIFAPVHELERQIQIINAYCREAEVINDPTFDTLWDLLDELIEAHTVFNSQSLFSESNKKTAHETANELMKIMPAFRKRLDKREYDFILVKPVKRRMLLKMYALGLFLNGRSSKVQESVTKKLRFDQMPNKPPPYPWKYGSTGSREDSSYSDSISVPNTAGTIDKFSIRGSVEDLLKKADSVTNNIVTDSKHEQVLFVHNEKGHDHHDNDSG